MMNQKDKKVEMFFSALFHDVGKPDTLSFNEKKQDFQNIHHDKVGAEITQKWLSDSGVPKRLHKSIVSLVDHHMVDINMKDKKILKMADDLAKDNLTWDDLLKIRTADGQGRINLNKSVEDQTKENDSFRTRIENLGVLNSKTVDFVTGKDLVSIGFKPGKGIGEMLQEVKILQYAGRVNSKEDAMKHVETRFKNLNENS